MNKDPRARNQYSIPFSSIIPFLLITFIISWGVLGFFIFLPGPMTRLFGQLSGDHPLFFLAVWAPAIAAFIIIGFKTGLSGLRHFLRKILLWKTGVFWYLFLIIGLPLVFYAGSALKGNLFSSHFPFLTFPPLFIAMGLMMIKGPVEEFGWRGFALPLFQRKFAPFWAGLIVGVIWGFWHLPAFMLAGTQQSDWQFLPFFVGVVSISLIKTALFNDSKGSILLPAVMHFQLINPIWPDAQPYDTYILTAAAVVLVLVKSGAMFSKSGGITEISHRS